MVRKQIGETETRLERQLSKKPLRQVDKEQIGEIENKPLRQKINW